MISTPNKTAKPLVSFIIVCYKQEEYIAESLQSALDQGYSPLEIIVSDDCSPDRTFEIACSVAERYRGPHSVVLQRNDRNLGLSGNINEAVKRSRGEFLVLHAGDDIALPNRTESLTRRWMDSVHPVDLVVSHFAEIDETGQRTGFVKEGVAFTPEIEQPVWKWRCGATGACAAYSRRVFEKYGPLDPRVIAEDWVLSFRAWLESGIAIVPEPLLLHRTHSRCLSVIYSGRSIEELATRAERIARRRRTAESKLAIAEEWLKAAQLSDRGGDSKLINDLKRLIQFRRIQASAYEAPPWRALALAVRLCASGGGIGPTRSMLLRNALRIQ